MPPFTKPLSSLAQPDLERLIVDGMAEGSDLELKQALSTKGDGSPDSWYAGASSIGERARNQIMDELVAFANAEGGYLVLGVEETADQPPRAARLTAVPRCADLAHRIELMARDCIEPLLPILAVQSVPLAADGSGAVIVHVPQSRSAPHRVVQTQTALIRRSNRSEKMTMREIQELTLRRASTRDLATAQCAEYRERFLSRISSLHQATTKGAIGWHVTLVPLGAPLHVERLFNHPDIRPQLIEVPLRYRTSSSRTMIQGANASQRPILRGVRYSNDEGEQAAWGEIKTNGVMDFGFTIASGSPFDQVFPEWFFGTVMSALLTANVFRRSAGAPGVEYAVSIELSGYGTPLVLGGIGQASSRYGELLPNPLVLPELSLGLAREIPQLLAIVWRDLLNAAGYDHGSDVLAVDIPAVHLE